MFSLASLLLSALLARQEPDPGWQATVEAHLAAGDTDRALQVLEAELVARPRDAELEVALARALERHVDAGGPWLAMSDARDAWDRALTLRPGDLDTCCGAIAVRLRLGEHEAALALAERALGAAWLESGRAPAPLLELACRARLGALGESVQDGDRGAERAEKLRKAWSALEHARALAPGSAELVRLAAVLLEAEGLPQRAAAELTAALERSSAIPSLHRTLIDLHLREGIEERLPAVYERWSEAGTNGTLAWYTGYAWRLAGDLAQRERRFADALHAYERASEWAGVAATLEPRYRETAETIRHQAQVSAGWCELDQGALDAADERLLALLRTRTERRDETDGLGRSLMHALSALGERRVAGADFERAAAEARAVVALVPDDGRWWNNLGFLLREHATQLESGTIAGVEQRELRAREVFRESWRAYRRAVELAPRDARVVNDAALVQVYHLRDELAEAEALLERAVALGEEELARLGARPDERSRFPVAQALGDACLNLGYLCYHVYRQPARSREWFERAMASDSGDRSELREYLLALEGKRGPVPEQDRGAFVPPPRRAPPARVEIPWEASLAVARERARAEGRALVVYVRGQALGLAVPALDELVRSPRFAEAARAAVLVLADAERATFVDRRHDGRRVSCPRFGTVTCSEHIACHEELSSWWLELFGSEPGESEEGLWLLRPGAEAPEPVRDLDALLAEGGDGLPLAVEPFEAVEASLGGEDGGGEARALVSARELSARLVVERILWEGFSSSPARGHLLAALAEDPRPGSHELLGSCVRQSSDPELQLAALAVWPAGLDLAPVRHAWRWSGSAEVREAAERVLAREQPDDPVWAARAALGAR